MPKNVPKRGNEAVAQVNEKPHETTVEFLASLAGVLVTGFFVAALLAWPPAAAGLARRARKPVHHPRSLVRNPARTLQDR